MVIHPNAKVNLGLNVIRKREDGYHDLQTVFIPVMDYTDTLELVSGDDYSHTSAGLFARYEPGSQIVQGISPDGKLMITLARNEGIDWDPLSDLCARAYMMLDRDYSLPPVKIFLEKTIPVGAGLGGGSADAAFTLSVINDLFGLGLEKDILAEYASRLGSDCPFFIYDTPMLGTGRGEKLEPFYVDMDGYELRVVVPEGISVSTKEAYSGIIPREAEGFRLPTGIEDMPLHQAASRPVEQWKNLITNDFEPSVFSSYPALAAIKQSLYDSGAVYASLSGSGSALFGIYHK